MSGHRLVKPQAPIQPKERAKEPLASPRTISGRYEVIKEIQGPNSTIYKANDTRSGKLVAVKEVGMAHCTAAGSFKPLGMIEREFRAGRGISHPNLTAYHEAFQDEKTDSYYLVRDWAEGIPLDEIAGNGRRLDDRQIKDVMLKVVDAVGHLHSQNPPIIHRDIKPANIIVVMDGNEVMAVKLIDLGAIPEDPQNKKSGTKMTSHIGTPGFMAPEALSNPCPASDFFSIGATILYLKCGKDADDIYDRGRGRFDIPPEVGGNLRKILQRTLMVGTDERFAKAQEIKDALNASEDTAMAKTQDAWIEGGEKRLVSGAGLAAVVVTFTPLIFGIILWVLPKRSVIGFLDSGVFASLPQWRQRDLARVSRSKLGTNGCMEALQSGRKKPKIAQGILAYGIANSWLNESGVEFEDIAKILRSGTISDGPARSKLCQIAGRCIKTVAQAKELFVNNWVVSEFEESGENHYHWITNPADATEILLAHADYNVQRAMVKKIENPNVLKQVLLSGRLSDNEAEYHAVNQFLFWGDAIELLLSGKIRGDHQNMFQKDSQLWLATRLNYHEDRARILMSCNLTSIAAIKAVAGALDADLLAGANLRSPLGGETEKGRLLSQMVAERLAEKQTDPVKCARMLKDWKIGSRKARIILIDNITSQNDALDVLVSVPDLSEYEQMSLAGKITEAHAAKEAIGSGKVTSQGTMNHLSDTARRHAERKGE